MKLNKNDSVTTIKLRLGIASLDLVVAVINDFMEVVCLQVVAQNLDLVCRLSHRENQEIDNSPPD